MRRIRCVGIGKTLLTNKWNVIAFVLSQNGKKTLENFYGHAPGLFSSFTAIKIINNNRISGQYDGWVANNGAGTENIIFFFQLFLFHDEWGNMNIVRKIINSVAFPWLGIWKRSLFQLLLHFLMQLRSGTIKDPFKSAPFTFFLSPGFF